MKKNYGFTLVELVISVIVLGLLASLIISFSSFAFGGDEAITAAEAQGFTDIQVINTHRWIFSQWNGCGEDWKATVIRAKNFAGKEVTFTVCEGFFLKGATIRH